MHSSSTLCVRAILVRLSVDCESLSLGLEEGTELSERHPASETLKSPVRATVKGRCVASEGSIRGL